MTTPGFDQYLVDYTVRNITTGDEEDIRVLELTPDEFDGFPYAVREDVHGYVLSSLASGAPERGDVWQVEQQKILELLLPYISDRAGYDNDYGTWEARLLGDDNALNAFPPEDIADAVRTILTETVDAAIENWSEGYWADITTRTTHGELLRMLVGFIETWLPNADDIELNEAMGFNAPILKSDES